ncbi:MAG TPA: hypothetical protein VK854_10110, partial [Woeseiaceae bacterium]|nr:hypothetical protein [Woeseiaceae bacterium]
YAVESLQRLLVAVIEGDIERNLLQQFVRQQSVDKPSAVLQSAMQLVQQRDLLLQELRWFAPGVKQCFALILWDSRVIEVEGNHGRLGIVLSALRNQEWLTLYQGRHISGIPAVVPQKQVLISFQTE